MEEKADFNEMRRWRKVLADEIVAVLQCFETNCEFKEKFVKLTTKRVSETYERFIRDECKVITLNRANYNNRVGSQLFQYLDKIEHCTRKFLKQVSSKLTQKFKTYFIKQTEICVNETFDTAGMADTWKPRKLHSSDRNETKKEEKRQKKPQSSKSKRKKPATEAPTETASDILSFVKSLVHDTYRNRFGESASSGENSSVRSEVVVATSIITSSTSEAPFRSDQTPGPSKKSAEHTAAEPKHKRSPIVIEPKLKRLQTAKDNRHRGKKSRKHGAATESSKKSHSVETELPARKTTDSSRNELFATCDQMKTTNGPSAPKSRRETVTKDGNSKDKGQLKRKSDENDRNGDKRSRPNASESTKKDKQTVARTHVKPARIPIADSEKENRYVAKNQQTISSKGPWACGYGQKSSKTAKPMEKSKSKTNSERTESSKWKSGKEHERTEDSRKRAESCKTKQSAKRRSEWMVEEVNNNATAEIEGINNASTSGTAASIGRSMPLLDDDIEEDTTVSKKPSAPKSLPTAPLSKAQQQQAAPVETARMPNLESRNPPIETAPQSVDGRELRCAYCLDGILYQPASVMDHLTSKHAEFIDDEAARSQASAEENAILHLICNDCNECIDLDDYLVHQQDTHRVECSECGIISDNYVRHVQDHHSSEQFQSLVNEFKHQLVNDFIRSIVVLSNGVFVLNDSLKGTRLDCLNSFSNCVDLWIAQMKENIAQTFVLQIVNVPYTAGEDLKMIMAKWFILMNIITEDKANIIKTVRTQTKEAIEIYCRDNETLERLKKTAAETTISTRDLVESHAINRIVRYDFEH